MTCEELKNKVISKTVDDSLLILVYSDSTFVINQYINQISSDKNLTKLYIDSIKEIAADADDFFNSKNDVLYILYMDKLDCTEELLRYNNLIIVCKSVANKDVCSNNIVVFDKLNKEQVLEYMQLLCPSVSIDSLNWLYDIADGDIYRIDSELKKIKIFGGNQQDIFNLIYREDGYSDLTKTSVFNCINAFINKDMKALTTILQNIDSLDIEGPGLVTLMITNIENIIKIQTNPKATAESLGMDKRKFYAISRSCGKFTDSQLIDMFEFLTGIDYRLKSGLLELSKESFIGYILSELMGIGYQS